MTDEELQALLGIEMTAFQKAFLRMRFQDQVRIIYRRKDGKRAAKKMHDEFWEYVKERMR